MLPEGFRREPGVYHFDPMFGRWFQIPSAGVDIENNEIYFVTNHFSSFSVQATMIQDLTPQEYKDAGYSPLKAYVEHGGITVSPQFGTASTEVTELVYLAVMVLILFLKGDMTLLLPVMMLLL